MKKSKTVSQSSSKPSGAMLEARNSFLLQSALGGEELKCVGYNPDLQRSEALVDIKQSTGTLDTNPLYPCGYTVSLSARTRRGVGDGRIQTLFQGGEAKSV
jgi:hypothetical protein